MWENYFRTPRYLGKIKTSMKSVCLRGTIQKDRQQRQILKICLHQQHKSTDRNGSYYSECWKKFCTVLQKPATA